MSSVGNKSYRNIKSGSFKISIEINLAVRCAKDGYQHNLEEKKRSLVIHPNLFQISEAPQLCPIFFVVSDYPFLLFQLVQVGKFIYDEISKLYRYNSFTKSHKLIFFITC